MSESTNTWGPRGTYGCACVSDNSFNCSLIRYGFRGDDGEPERCECLCHQWRTEDDEDDDLPAAAVRALGVTKEGQQP